MASAVHAWHKGIIPALKLFCSVIMMIQNRKPVGGSSDVGRWLHTEAFGTVQMITWLDVSCWQQVLNLVAEDLNRATERVSWNLFFEGWSHLEETCSEQVILPTWVCMKTQSKSQVNVWIYQSKRLQWVSHMVNESAKCWIWAPLALKGVSERCVLW